MAVIWSERFTCKHCGSTRPSPQRLFDTQLMEVQYFQSESESQDQSVDGELSEIEKTINEFRKRIEE